MCLEIKLVNEDFKILVGNKIKNYTTIRIFFSELEIPLGVTICSLTTFPRLLKYVVRPLNYIFYHKTLWMQITPKVGNSYSITMRNIT